ncbi:hypothetical protein Tco_1283696 [Tanacetum coccineum]
MGPNNEFEELLYRSTQKLYPVCDMSTLEFTTEISHIKALHKITDAGFNKILALLQKACPPSKGYNFPSAYYEIKKTYKKIVLGYESIHACINDCFLFWGSEENLKMSNCPVCKESINSELTEVDVPVNDDNANANEGNAEDDVVAHVLDDDDDVVVSDDDEVNPSTNVEEVLSSDDSDEDNRS